MQEKINTLTKLGEYIEFELLTNVDALSYSVARENPWFTKENIQLALNSWANALQKDNLEKWLFNYNNTNNVKRVGIVAAGNIPLVSFHDFITVLVSGHDLVFKKSQTDSVLITLIFNYLKTIDEKLSSKITFAERLNNIDAVIATGSNNSARYFEYYFSKIPNIIRKNRTSVAVLDGKESIEELKALNNDIFSYFGLGCRNVSKIYVPFNYNMNDLFAILEQYQEVKQHTKYMNNYEYTRTVWLLNNEIFFDTGNLNIKESENLHSGIGCLFFERYNSESELQHKLKSIEDQLQCVVGNVELGFNKVKFGQTQFPQFWDYADNINTLEFLKNL